MLLDAISLLAAKDEATPGTAEALTGTEAAMVVHDLAFSVTETIVDRPNPVGQGTENGTVTIRTADVSFKVEFAGKGSSGLPLWASTLLPACNLETSTGAATTFSLVTGTHTVTLARYHDGKKEVAYGCRGNVKFGGNTNEIGYAEFAFKGLYDESADTSMLAPTLPTVKAPIGLATFTLASYSPFVSKWELDLGNNVILRPCATGYISGAIVNRDVTLTCDPEDTLTSDRDWESLRNAGTEEAVSIIAGSVSNNTQTFAGTRCQWVNIPKGNRDGIAIRNVVGKLRGTTPLTLLFG
jgi:hypothetical protein